jgi:hypothetical protein
MSPLYTEVYRQVDRLRDGLGPDLIGIAAFKVNILTNQQVLVVALATDAYKEVVQGLVEDVWQYPQPAFRDDPIINHVLVRLYLGRFVCTPPHDGWKNLRRLPYKELCFIGVPPDGIGLAGFIGGAWEEKLDSEKRDKIEAAFRNASEAIVWHHRKLGGQ